MDHITFGQLPAIRITAPDGATAVVTLYGAHLVSWHGADGGERVFLPRIARLPSSAERGDGMRHGFARVSTWRLEDSGVEDGAAWAVFGLNEADLPPAMAGAWPHRFALQLRVAVRANELIMALNVRNTGDAAFPFAAALHSYHLVPHLADVRIEGLEAGTLSIADKLDVVYEQVDDTIFLGTWARVLTLEQEGFSDAVVWNPGAADTAALADMEDEEYQRFVCIEPAQLTPVQLEPGAAWEGRYRVS
jgi:glucose-6-phosphate 1-epimerase